MSMSIEKYLALRDKGFRASIAFEIIKIGKCTLVFPKEEFALPSAYTTGTPHTRILNTTLN